MVKKISVVKRKKELIKELEKTWKQKVFEIWGDRCICGDPAQAPHHFIERARNGLMMWDVKNGVPICNKCHFVLTFGSMHSDNVYQLIKRIRESRGQEWCNYIDEHKKIHKSSFKTLEWLQSQLDILKGLNSSFDHII